MTFLGSIAKRWFTSEQDAQEALYHRDTPEDDEPAGAVELTEQDQAFLNTPFGDGVPAAAAAIRWQENGALLHEMWVVQYLGYVPIRLVTVYQDHTTVVYWTERYDDPHNLDYWKSALLLPKDVKALNEIGTGYLSTVILRANISGARPV